MRGSANPEALLAVVVVLFVIGLVGLVVSIFYRVRRWRARRRILEGRAR